MTYKLADVIWLEKKLTREAKGAQVINHTLGTMAWWCFLTQLRGSCKSVSTLSRELVNESLTQNCTDQGHNKGDNRPNCCTPFEEGIKREKMSL